MSEYLPPLVAALKGDITDFQSKMGVARKEMTSTQSGFDKLASIGKVAFLGLAAGATTFGAIAVREAVQQEAANARLTTSLNNVGSHLTALSKPLEEAQAAARKMGFSDDLATESLAKLVAATKDPTKAIKDLAIAQDVARGRGIDLAAATDILTKVETGHVALLGRIGINVKDNTGATINQEEALKRLSSLYGGQASAYANTFAGRMAVLRAETGELAEKVGFMLIPKIEALVHIGSSALEWAQNHRVAVKALAAVIAGPLVAAIGAYLAVQTKVVATKAADFFVGVTGAITKLATAMYTLTEAEGVVTIGFSTLGAGAIAASGGLGVLMYIMNRTKQAASEMARNIELAAGSDIQAQIDALKIKAAQLRGEFETTPHLGGMWLSDSAAHAKTAYQQVNSEIKRLQAELQGQKRETTGANAITNEYNQTITQTAADAKKFSDGVAAMRSSLIGLISAQKGVKDAQQGVKDATAAQASAQRQLNELVAKGAVDTAAVTAAQKKYDQATTSVTDALQSQADAEAALTKVMQGTSAEDKGKATLALNGALRGQAQAAINLHKAQDNLTKVQKDTTSTADDLKQAQLDLADAQDAVQEKAYGVADAQQALNDAIAYGTPQSEAYQQAQQQVATAADAVKKATEDQQQALDDLNTAQAGDPAFAQKIADAQDAVAQARRGVATATDQVTTATLALYDAQKKEADAIATGGDAVNGVIAQLADFASQFPGGVPLVQQLEGLPGVSDAVKIAAATAAYQNQNINLRTLPKIKAGGARAAGGPVVPGYGYTVNEQGVETFVPSVPGTVMPAGTQAAGSNIIIQINLPGGMVLDAPGLQRLADQLVQPVASSLNRAARNGTNWNTGLRIGAN